MKLALNNFFNLPLLEWKLQSIKIYLLKFLHIFHESILLLKFLNNMKINKKNVIIL